MSRNLGWLLNYTVKLESEIVAICTIHKYTSAVTILKSKSKIAIFCQNRPKSKLLHLLCHVSISSCFDFLQQLMDVTGLKDYNFRRFQTEYCVYTKHGLKIE